MRDFRESQIYQLMNRNGILDNQLREAGKAINGATIINNRLESLEPLRKIYRETVVLQALKAVEKNQILLVVLPEDKRFPAHIPFMKTKSAKPIEVIDLSKYAKANKDEDGKIISYTMDVDKLYVLLVSAYLDLVLFSESTALSSESIKRLSIMWAKMFNKILQAKKIFVGNKERQDAFMYFAMKFCMKYYIQCPDPVIDSVCEQFIGPNKSRYILFVEENLAKKDIDLYQDWTTFARTMFDNEVTNLASFNPNGGGMDIRLYLQSFEMYMGKDGAYMALWSIPYFVFCCFSTNRKAGILNDRAWADVVLDDARMIPKLMDSFYKEL